VISHRKGVLVLRQLAVCQRDGSVRESASYPSLPRVTATPTRNMGAVASFCMSTFPEKRASDSAVSVLAVTAALACFFSRGHF